MNHEQLDQILRQLNPIEQKQIVTRININEFGGEELLPNNENKIPRMKEKYFFDRGPIYISKHHRFAKMPLHTHDFVEINYVYAGCCHQIINNQHVKLEQGQLCILDKDVPHEIMELENDDILINIIMKKESFSSSFFNRLAKAGILSAFLLNAASEDQDHNKYIVFHSQNNENLQYIMKNIICEYMDPIAYSTEIINNYMLVMFTELMRVYQHHKNFDETESYQSKVSIIDLLTYIESNYQTATLKEMAKTFNFNANYLSNMLKEKTGKTFTELLQTQRMIQASQLLLNTDKSITEISLYVGYENYSFFHKKFKAHYRCTPRSFRVQKKPG